MAAFGERVVKEAKPRTEVTDDVNRSEVGVENGDSGSTSGGGDPAFKRLPLHHLYISSKSLSSILQALPPSISQLALDSVYSGSTLFKSLEQYRNPQYKERAYAYTRYLRFCGE
jgi:hypothetical protein